MKGTRMRCIKQAQVLVFILFVRCIIASAAGATNFNTIFAFNGTNGQFPEAALIQGSDGNLYGTTMGGGVYTNWGTIFRISPDGSFTNLYSFDFTNGASPQTALIQGANGYLYGTAYEGGAYDNGVVYKMSTNGALTVLAPFSVVTDGYQPNAMLSPETNGSFYGMTTFGGSNSLGSVFSITASGLVTTVASFNGTNGAWPYVGGLIQGADGNFYGTTPTGGIGFDSTNDYSGFGTVFKMTAEGQITTLLLFNGTNGAFPVGLLVQGSDGCLYGTTCYGGLEFDGTQYSGDGTVFKITTNGYLTTLVSFNVVTNGANPFAGLCLGTDGNFYGTTQYGGTNYPPNPDAGTVFQMTPDGTLATLVSFNYNDGEIPMAALVQGSDGSFYGTTTQGGTGGLGTVFRLDVGLQTNSPSSLGPFFTGSVALSADWDYLGTVGDGQYAFGYFSPDQFPFIYHLDLGWEYYFDANNAAHGAYFYDFSDGIFFYTEPGIFPFLYDFNMNAWMFCAPQNGYIDRYQSGPRWFLNMSTTNWVNHL